MLKSIGKKLLSPLQRIIHDSRSLGIILSICTVLSITLSNMAFGNQYMSFWLREFHFPEFLHLPHSLVHWINDAFMSIFFFMVGMEIKRELLDGELKNFRRAILPIVAALGGMLVPAAIYAMVNRGTPYAGGWGIPMATDIAFSLGIASLLGSRVPVSLKIFLTALAIIDDLGAIAMIAIFYGGKINWMYILATGGITLLIYILSKRAPQYKTLRYFLAIFLWYFVFQSGVHATVAGVIFAFTIPLEQLSALENRLHVPVNFLILPVFALANTAILIPADFLSALSHPLNMGIITGLVLGKPLGILLFSYALVQLKWGELPAGVSWAQVAGIGILAGIGFTMSIFIATLAFSDSSTQDLAKIGVLMGSLLSVIFGCLVLYFFSKKLTTVS